MEGESSYKCYVKLVKDIFGVKLKLIKVTFCSDWGYWILKVLKYLFENGANVHDTVRSQDWYGFTYDTDLKEGDPRININKAGPSTLYTAAADILDCTVSANAFRNGTGGVASTILTLYLEPNWEYLDMSSGIVDTSQD